MYRIGEFSKLCRVPVSALRYYSDLGLLPAAAIDPDSGYRHYSVSQLPRLNRILALKDLGLSLDEIQAMLDDELSPEELRGMLRFKRSEISQLVAEQQARLVRVENRLRVIESEGNMPTIEVVLKRLNPVHVLSLREVVSDPRRGRDHDRRRIGGPATGRDHADCSSLLVVSRSRVQAHRTGRRDRLPCARGCSRGACHHGRPHLQASGGARRASGGDRASRPV